MKKLKDVIKKNPGPASDGNYTNPSQLGQYSAQNQIAEDSTLERYLASKGIEPGSISRETKSGHARSNEFAKWKNNHMNEDMTVGRTSGSDIRSKQSNSPTRKRFSQLKKATGHYEVKPVTTHTQLHGESTKKSNRKSSGTAGDSMKGDLNIIKTYFINKLANNFKSKPKEQPKAKVEPSIKENFKQKTWIVHDFKGMPQKRFSDENEAKKHAEKHDMEYSSSEDFAYAKKGRSFSRHTPGVWAEDVGDAKAAVNADGLPNPQLEPVSEKKKKTLQSFKEDMHDWEKEDKSVKTYGKKPKFDKAEKDEGGSEKKPTAAATLSGGTTLTGSKRDTVEIDPAMRNRPGQPDVTKKDEKKKEEKSEKKQDKK